MSGIDLGFDRREVMVKVERILEFMVLSFGFA